MSTNVITSVPAVPQFHAKVIISVLESTKVVTLVPVGTKVVRFNLVPMGTKVFTLVPVRLTL